MEAMQKTYKSIRIFKSPTLERLTHVHPLTPLVVWSPIFAWLVWRTLFVDRMSLSSIFFLGFPGFFVWTLTEYLLHRFVFHYEGESEISQKLHFLIHGLHHADPIDPTRLVMPPAASLFIGGSLFLLFRLVLGPVLVEPFFMFFIIGYLGYDYIHFAVHHFRPRTRIGMFLKNSHMQHHYVSASSRWGVSSPFWDYIFGTLEDAKKKEQTV
jgi:sterol desaturase/sphingolipid hydroxylase (fatty acid hydroxylase superfamily)